MRKWNRAEIAGAAGFVALGILALVAARSYPLGTIVRMGPGFVPVAIGILLVLVGGTIAVQARTAEPAAFEFRPKPFVLILGGMLLWALLIDRIGFFAATGVLILCCAAVERDTTWMSALLLTCALCAAGYGIFIWGIGIPLSSFGE